MTTAYSEVIDVLRLNDPAPPASGADAAAGVHPRAELSLDQVVRQGHLRTVFQPIVDLATGAVQAHEALTRGPEGRWSSPADLFTGARAAGLLAELDHACRLSAFRAAVRTGLVSPSRIFVNVEPEVLESGALDELAAFSKGVPAGLDVVLEVTERSLASRPAELLRTVESVRGLGWRVALDDVGAEPASLAFMALLRPEVVKLDLGLVQAPASRPTAEVMHAVNAYAEASGAVVLAEGIETEQHLDRALALGATWGQGWLLGRPTATPEPPAAAGLQSLAWTPPLVAPPFHSASPFACLPVGSTSLRRSSKRLLVELSKQLEREAVRLGPTSVVAATFQYARHFAGPTRQRYAELAAATGFVCVLGEGLSETPMPGVRGATLTSGDPVLGEWDVVVLSPHFSAALLARDLGDDGPEMERRFEYALTYDRETVVLAAQALLSRVAPRGAERLTQVG